MQEHCQSDHHRYSMGIPYVAEDHWSLVFLALQTPSGEDDRSKIVTFGSDAMADALPSCSSC